jgi:hypothetical protein
MTSDGDLVSAPASGEEFGQVFDRGLCDALEGLAGQERLVARHEDVGNRHSGFHLREGVPVEKHYLVNYDSFAGLAHACSAKKSGFAAPFPRHQHVNRFRTNPGGLLVGLQFQAFQAQGVSDDRYRAE